MDRRQVLNPLPVEMTVKEKMITKEKKEVMRSREMGKRAQGAA